MPKCPRCGKELRYVSQLNSWWCDYCKYYPFAASQSSPSYNTPMISSTSETGMGDWIVGLGIFLLFICILGAALGGGSGIIFLFPISVTTLIAGAAIMAYEKSQRRASNAGAVNQTFYVAPPPASPPVQRTSGVKERLLELERLRADNLISAEEYESRRRKILDEL